MSCFELQNFLSKKFDFGEQKISYYLVKPNFFLRVIFIFFAVLSFTNQTSAQNISGCPYEFSRNLTQGSTGQDVLVLQRLLNSDKRTLLAPTGVGSPGKETTNFGKGTKGALKRFQALFIEYIEVADGVFNDKTRQVVQTICNEEGKYANFGDKQGSKITAPKEKTPPPPGANITLSTDDLVVNVGQDFKVLVSVDKEVKGLPSESFIIDGATMKDVRKMSKLSYIVFFTPAENAKVAVIQIEAEKVTSTDGGKNEFASNEVVVKVLGGGVDTQNATPTNIFGNISQTLEGLLQSALGERPQTKFCNGVQIPFDSPCNPSIGNPGGGSGSGEGSGGGSSGGGYMKLSSID
jgi:hypothetical protein